MADKRAQLVAEMQQRVKEKAPVVVEVLHDLATNPDVPEKMRTKARNDLKARGLWKGED